MTGGFESPSFFLRMVCFLNWRTSLVLAVSYRSSSLLAWLSSSQYFIREDTSFKVKICRVSFLSIRSFLYFSRREEIYGVSFSWGSSIASSFFIGVIIFLVFDRFNSKVFAPYAEAFRMRKAVSELIGNWRSLIFYTTFSIYCT